MNDTILTPSANTRPVRTQYEDYLRYVDTNGRSKTDRTGTGTKSVFGYQMRFDLADGFPLVTTKKVHLKAIIEELRWFIMGSSNNNWLKERGVSIWNEWAKENGDLGPIYGVQWRSWPVTGEKVFVQFNVHQRMEKALEFAEKSPELLAFEVNPQSTITRQNQISDYLAALYFRLDQAEKQNDQDAIDRIDDKLLLLSHALRGEERNPAIDQLTEVINTIKTNPDSRRMIVSAWNVADLPKMALPPCHALFQFYVSDLTREERARYAIDKGIFMKVPGVAEASLEHWTHPDGDAFLDYAGVPTKKLSCQLYQR